MRLVRRLLTALGFAFTAFVSHSAAQPLPDSLRSAGVSQLEFNNEVQRITELAARRGRDARDSLARLFAERARAAYVAGEIDLAVRYALAGHSVSDRISDNRDALALIMHDMSEARILARYVAPYTSVGRSAVLAGDSIVLASPQVTLLDRRTGALRHVIHRRADSVFAPSESSVFSEDSIENTNTLWGLDGGARLGNFQEVVAAWSNDGRFAVWSASWRLHLIRTADGEVRELPAIWALNTAGSSPHFSDDGARLAVFGGDGTVSVYDTETARQLSSLRPANYRDGQLWDRFGVNQLEGRLSDDGQIVAFVRLPENVLEVWDVNTGQQLFTRQVADFERVLFVANGMIATTVGQELMLVRAADGVEVRRMIIDENAAFSPSYGEMATWREDNSGRLVDLQTGEAIAEFENVRFMAFNANGRRLNVTYTSGETAFANLNGREISRFRGYAYQIADTDALGLNDGYLWHWPRINGREDLVRGSIGARYLSATLHLSPDGSYRADHAARRTERFEDGSLGPVYIMARSGEVISVLGMDGNAADRFEIVTLGNQGGYPHPDYVRETNGLDGTAVFLRNGLPISFSRDSRFVAVNDARFGGVWNPMSGRPVFLLPELWADPSRAVGPEGYDVGYNNLSFGSADRVLAVSYGDKVEIRALPSGRVLSTLDVGGIVTAHPTQDIVAVQQFEDAIVLYDWRTRQIYGGMRSRDGLFNLVFSPDGRLMATSTRDGRVRVWSVRYQAMLAEFNLPEEFLGAPEFSADSTQLLVAEGHRGAETREWRWDLTRLLQPMDVLSRDACNTLLGPFQARRRFSIEEAAADPLIRLVWLDRHDLEDDVCDGVSGAAPLQ